MFFVYAVGYVVIVVVGFLMTVFLVDKIYPTMTPKRAQETLAVLAVGWVFFPGFLPVMLVLGVVVGIIYVISKITEAVLDRLSNFD